LDSATKIIRWTTTDTVSEVSSNPASMFTMPMLQNINSSLDAFSRPGSAGLKSVDRT
jgi:hypothetical protein